MSFNLPQESLINSRPDAIRYYDLGREEKLGNVDDFLKEARDGLGGIIEGAGICWESDEEKLEEKIHAMTFLEFIRIVSTGADNFKSFYRKIRISFEAGQFGHGKTEKYIRELLSRCLLEGKLD